MATMKAFLSGVVAAIVVGLVAMYALNPSWVPADQAYTTTGARVTDAGHNLVGKDWASSRRF
jgi:hypothetical protein